MYVVSKYFMCLHLGHMCIRYEIFVIKNLWSAGLSTDDNSWCLGSLAFMPTELISAQHTYIGFSHFSSGKDKVEAAERSSQIH